VAVVVVVGVVVVLLVGEAAAVVVVVGVVVVGVVVVLLVGAAVVVVVVVVVVADDDDRDAAVVVFVFSLPTLYMYTSTSIICKKGSRYSINERRVAELIPVLGSQPAGDVSHKPGGRLPSLSARPAVTLATRGLLPILLLGEHRHDGCEQFA